MIFTNNHSCSGCGYLIHADDYEYSDGYIGTIFSALYKCIKYDKPLIDRGISPNRLKECIYDNIPDLYKIKAGVIS